MSATPATPDPEKPVSTKLLIPHNDAALATVAGLVASTWATETWFTLRWLKPADFAALAASFGATLTDKRAAAATRSPQAQRLQELDDEMDEALRVLKAYVLEAANYDKAAADAQLPGFGLVPRSGKGKSYELSRDRDERLAALRDFLLPAVARAPFAGRDRGTAFWQPRATEYAALLHQADGLAGQVTQAVSKKDDTKAAIRQALQAIVYGLRANYPDTYEAEWRAWGFRKVSY
jgi:hypothetical protein